jgi:hypothetical protein
MSESHLLLCFGAGATGPLGAPASLEARSPRSVLAARTGPGKTGKMFRCKGCGRSGFCTVLDECASVCHPFATGNMPGDRELPASAGRRSALRWKERAALSVNAELIHLYWEIGGAIAERQRCKGWGSGVIDRLAADLRTHFPSLRGFSPANIHGMRSFYLSYSQTDTPDHAQARGTRHPIVAQAVRQLHMCRLSELSVPRTPHGAVTSLRIQLSFITIAPSLSLRLCCRRAGGGLTR